MLDSTQQWHSSGQSQESTPNCHGKLPQRLSKPASASSWPSDTLSIYKCYFRTRHVHYPFDVQLFKWIDSSPIERVTIRQFGQRFEFLYPNELKKACWVGYVSVAKLRSKVAERETKSQAYVKLMSADR